MRFAVIADDLTGTAELAGAAAEMGLTAEVHTVFDPYSPADVIAVDTDTRSLTAAAARSLVAALTREVIKSRPEWIFKKTDSVLRGNVRAEIEEILEATSLRRAMLVPANPSKSRVIRDGIYFVQGVPLAQTSFATDPDHPRRSSSVFELLGETRDVPIFPPSVRLTDGIEVPDAETADQLNAIAFKTDHHTHPAGGVDFFRAILSSRLKEARPSASCSHSISLRGGTLFVCGSLQAWGQDRAARCDRHGIAVLPMPQEVTASALRDWGHRIGATVLERGCAMAAVGDREAEESEPVHPSIHAERLAEAVAVALANPAIQTVCVEGGATEAALLRSMGWTRLTTLPAAALTGVAMLRPFGMETPTLLGKPGSYPWPERLWSELQKVKD